MAEEAKCRGPSLRQQGHPGIRRGQVLLVSGGVVPQSQKIYKEWCD